MDDNQNADPNSLDTASSSSLEAPETVIRPSTQEPGDANIFDTSQVQSPDASANQPSPSPVPPTKSKSSLWHRLRNLGGKFNIYILLFGLVVLVAGIATYASFRASKNSAKNTSISGQTLSAQDLQNLKGANVQVGTNQQTLTIASNAIFNGPVLVKNSLDVAGTIHVGGAISLPGITVSGTSAFQNVQVGSNLSIAGSAAVQGSLTVQKSLAVSGGATFGDVISAPALVVDTLTLNKDLQLNRHIALGGSVPHASASTGAGSGGTVSINGNDTAGTVNINFGGGPIAGILANITFANAFKYTPHVVISPVGSSCSNLNYYVNRSTTGFSIGTTNGGSAGASCAFDYIAID